MNARASLPALPALRSLALLLALATPACTSATTSAAPTDTGVQADAAGDDASADANADTGPGLRTMVVNPLFGDMPAQNLFIDTNFASRQAGIGGWIAESGDNANLNAATYSSSLMSDAPDGIAANVAQLADGAKSTTSFELSLYTQVPGGPGPFHLHVWVSTLDATASATLKGVSIGVLASESATSTLEVHEDTTRAKVIAGRTWHLFDGQIPQDLQLAAFVLFDFNASKNTWLLQAPSFAPVALEPAASTSKSRPVLAPTTARPMTTRERELVRRYKSQPRWSVPANHPSITERPRTRLP